MADNPKSLASLADELERRKRFSMTVVVEYTVEPNALPPFATGYAESEWARKAAVAGAENRVKFAMRTALSHLLLPLRFERVEVEFHDDAALRAPTIAAVTDEMVEAALRTYATSPHLRELEQPFSSAPGPHDSEQARHDMRLAIEAALATPSPSPEDSSTVEQSVLNRQTDSSHGRERVGRAFDSPSSAMPSPTIAAPSPSDEVTAEGWIPFAEHEIVRKERDVHLETLARIEHAMAIGRAALKARKPADDGAGQ